MAKVRVNWGSVPDRLVKLYAVYNTAHNALHVLAKDETTAMSIAQAANHIYSAAPKIAVNYSRLAHEVKKPWPAKWRPHADLIDQAISRRFQGTLHLDDAQIYVGHEKIAGETTSTTGA